MTQEIFSYNTIGDSSDGKYTEKGSKFLAYALPMESREELGELLDDIKTQHPKARHICYAFRILDNGIPVEYSTDAGEPSGSAGAPILGVLKSRDLLNVCVVVVRYFGGTKLGIPGLIEAYKSSASIAVDNCRIETRERTETVRLEMPVSLQPHFYNTCKHNSMEILEPEYDVNRFSATIKLPLRDFDEQFTHLLKQISQRDYATFDDQLDFLDIRIVDPEGQ